MFTERLHHAGGATEGHASEAHAFQLLRRALRTGYTVTPTPQGGAVVTWTARRLRDGQVLEEDRSVTLTPQTPAGRLTGDVVAALVSVDQAAAPLPALRDGRPVVRVGVQLIGHGMTSRLYGHRLVVEERGRVRLTLVAHLALLAARGASPQDVAAVLLPRPAAATA
ncbi:hypothetical protein [Streptomyces sp. MNU103]|uniref:hypothetical protein n=1 Tax=Streptomyces sp. MNU103 TaxID=2560024 RepID=UPI001E2BF262|nr:hypothetical protein [Streptomyces sp. MNU103]